jgi:hypothetical protein
MPRLRRQHDAVEHRGDAGLRCDRKIDGADAAQEQRLVQCRVGLANVQRGHELAQRLDIEATGGFGEISADDRYRNGNVLQPLLALLRRDDDFVEPDLVCRVLCESRRGRQRGAQAGSERRQRCHLPISHLQSPSCCVDTTGTGHADTEAKLSRDYCVLQPLYKT